jgi:phosphate transport system substrate-binding protein
MKLIRLAYLIIIVSVFSSCGNDQQVREIEDSPTSGVLNVYYNEDLARHVKNHVYTFEGLYPDASVNAIGATEDQAIRFLLNDSCKGIIINRLLGENEKKAFEQKQNFPKYSALAFTGVALIVNTNSDLTHLTTKQVIELLSNKLVVKDSANKDFEPNAILDNKASAVTRYLMDSVLQGESFGPKCSATKNSLELINTITTTTNAIGFIDFAWLSDRDDSLFKAYKDRIRFIALGKTDTLFTEPNQSSFKLGNYPFTRCIYFIRNTGDFTLAKGFEAFMAGPKGQLMFLKQGLLPFRQAERIIEVNMKPLGEEEKKEE